MKSIPHRRALRAGLLAFAVAILAAQAGAGDISARLELTYQASTSPADSLTATFGDPNTTGVLADARLMWQHRWGDWAAQAHYKLSSETGDSAALSRAIAAAFPATSLNTFFDLTHTLSDADALVASHTIDRLFVSLSTPNTVIRVGRQALTWGSGLVFRPMDLVAPFSPDSTDTEFKPGVDMIYFQWLMDDGSDLEFIAVPRRDSIGGPATADASTFAMRYQTSLGDLGANLILARDHGDLTAGLGLSGSLGGAAWNAEIVPTQLADGTIKTSALANITTATQLFDRTTILFAEAFHNGFGQTGTGLALDTLPISLADRIARGQVFNVSQDYLALGLSMQITPLITLGSAAILNLNDQSYLASAEVNWSLSDNANLMLGTQIPRGATGSEFGGLSVSGGIAPFAVPPATAYLRYRQYF